MMRPLLMILACTVALSAAGQADDESLVQVTPSNRADWEPLFSALASQAPLVATFVERRVLPFRREPVELSGELRISPDHGLSLHYLGRREHFLIVDDDGVLIRDARGRSRPVRTDAQAPAIDADLPVILSFNLDHLLERFDIEALVENSGWKLRFTPRDDTVSDSVKRIQVEGVNEEVSQIVLHRSDSHRIEIEITDSSTQVTFSGDDLERFFR